ncbi:site-specific integrase [Methanofollis ethanolicus]|uniref:site-specific integrase n=1 Tax=Methanofollis ethanolicus TaxID=488124 RepID=UPI00082E673D|nr:site-specific integrase [Methanofollis ethanolicus]
MGSTTAPTQEDRAFHLVKPVYAHRSVDRALAEGRLTEDDATLIAAFITEQQASCSLTTIRVNKLVYLLVNWRRFVGPYRTNAIFDLYTGINNLKGGTNQRGKPFKQNTLHDHIILLKRFYLWLIENDISTVPSKKVKAIKAPSMDRNTKLPEQMLTSEEIRALIAAGGNSRDRAFVAVLYESGCRIGEIGRLSWERVSFDKHGAVLTVEDTKCHKSRHVRLVMSLPYLVAWRNDYPFEPTGRALVFITTRKTPLQYATAAKILTTLAERAGVKKRVTPHLFRHSRITHLITQGVTESVIKLMMWGNLSTDMFQTYAHLAGADIDREILGHYGVTVAAEAADQGLEPRECPECHTINAPTARYCTTCYRSLTGESTATIAGMEADIVAHPQAIRAIVEEMINEKKKRGEI